MEGQILGDAEVKMASHSSRDESARIVQNVEGGGPSAQYEWVRGEHVETTDVVPFRVFLNQQKKESLTKSIGDVSNHISKGYGQDKSLDEIRGLIRPPDSAHAEVKELLRSSNITEKFCAEDWDSYSCDKVPADSIENLLKAKFYAYQHNIELYVIR